MTSRNNVNITESMEESDIVQAIFGPGIAPPTPPPIRVKRMERCGRDKATAMRRIAATANNCNVVRGTTPVVGKAASKKKKTTTVAKEPPVVKGLDGRYASNTFWLKDRVRLPHLEWVNKFGHLRLPETVPAFELDEKSRQKRLKTAYVPLPEYGEAYYNTDRLKEQRETEREINRSNAALRERILNANAVVSSLHPAVCLVKHRKRGLYESLLPKHTPVYVGAFRPRRFYGRFVRINFEKIVRKNMFMGCPFDKMY